jgi:hypothetical protein
MITRIPFRICGAILIGAPFLSAIGCASESVEPKQRQSAQEGRAQLVFEEAYSKTGHIRVFRNPTSSDLIASVAGIIGKDDPVAVGQQLDGSLVDIHRRLQPDTPVPEALIEFDKQLSLSVASNDRPLAQMAEGDPIGTGGFGAFQDTACRTHLAHCSYYTVLDCDYNSAVDIVCIPDYNTWATNPNRSYYWNEANDTSDHYLSGVSGSAVGVEPWEWGYTIWPNQTGTACLETNNAVEGNLGITIHSWNSQSCLRSGNPESQR